MGRYVAEHVVKKLISVGSPVKNARVAVLGFTFKENCPDTRNTKVIDIITELREYGINPMVCDPVADAQEAEHLYNIKFTPLSNLKELDALIVAVAHTEFQQFSLEDLDSCFAGAQKVIVDVKSLFDRQQLEQAGYSYWSL
jgi:UDP-N-acetyl-D-galactosamine dehydrogenase